MTQLATPKQECPLSTAQLVDLIYAFVELYNKPAGVELYDYQALMLRRVIESILIGDGATLTSLWARQSGKSEAISALSGALCIFLPTLANQWPDDQRLQKFREGFFVGIFAPRQQQSNVIYERIRNRANRESSQELYADPDINVTVRVSRGDRVEWSNGSYVISSTASEQTNVEGGTFHLIIIDEAQLVSQKKIDKEISAMLTATNGSMVEIGTVDYSKGAFLRQIETNKDRQRNGGRRDHFEFDYEVVIAQKRKKYEETGNAFHLQYEKYISATIDNLRGNIDNEEFRMNYRLLWSEGQKLAIDPDALLDAADDRFEAGTIDLSRRRVAGLDFGKHIDKSVLTVNEIGNKVAYSVQPILRDDQEPRDFYEKTFVAWKTFYGRWSNQLPDIVEYLREMRVDVLLADCTGIGDPLVEQLQNLMPGVLVIGWPFSLPKKDRLYKHYIEELETGRQSYVAGTETRETEEYEMFINEHKFLEKYYAGHYLSPRAPEGMHDDYPDSGALACMAAEFDPMESVEAECTEGPFAGAASTNHIQARAERYR